MIVLNVTGVTPRAVRVRFVEEKIQLAGLVNSVGDDSVDGAV